jgi:hypothetical protein
VVGLYAWPYTWPTYCPTTGSDCIAATIKEFAPYALLPPLVTLVLGLLGVWVVSGFARKGA